MSKVTRIIKQCLAMLTVITFPLAGQATVLWHDTFERAANGTGNGTEAFSLDESSGGMSGTLFGTIYQSSNTYLEATGGKPVITTNGTFACEQGWVATGLNYDFTEADLETVASGEFAGQYHMRVSYDKFHYTTGLAANDVFDRAIGFGICYQSNSIAAGSMVNWGVTGAANNLKGLRPGYDTTTAARNSTGAPGAMYFDIRPAFGGNNSVGARNSPHLAAYFNGVGKVETPYMGIVNGESTLTVDFFFDGPVANGTVCTYFVYIDGSYAAEISNTRVLNHDECYLAFGTRGAVDPNGAGFDNLKIETFDFNPRPPMLTSVAPSIQPLTDTWTLINPSLTNIAVLSNQSESGFTAFLPDINPSEAAGHPIVLQAFADSDISQIGQSFSFDFDMIVDDISEQSNNSWNMYVYDTNTNYEIGFRSTWGPADTSKSFQIRIGQIMASDSQLSNANVHATDYLGSGNVYTNFLQGDFFGRAIPKVTSSGNAESLYAGLSGDNAADFFGISDSTVVVHYSASISRIETNKLVLEIAWGDSASNTVSGGASFTLREDWWATLTQRMPWGV